MSKGGSAAVTNAKSLLRLTINAGQASPAPPVGPPLGQKGVKASDFCKIFNERSKNFLPGIPLPTKITVFSDRTFTFVIHVPTTFHLLKTACKFERGCTNQTVAIVPVKLIYEVAKIKSRDVCFENVPLRSVFKSVLATARHVGIKVLP